MWERLLGGAVILMSITLVAGCTGSAGAGEPSQTHTTSSASESPSPTPAIDIPESATPSAAEEADTLTSLFQTDMGDDAVGLMVIEDGTTHTVGSISFDIREWWEADAFVPGGYAELTYFRDPTDTAIFGFAVGLPPCGDDLDACLGERMDTLSGGHLEDFNVDVIEREALPGSAITLLSAPSSSSDNGWTAVAFVPWGNQLHEFLIGDTRGLAGVFAAIDSVRPA